MILFANAPVLKQRFVNLVPNPLEIDSDSSGLADGWSVATAISNVSGTPAFTGTYTLENFGLGYQKVNLIGGAGYFHVYHTDRIYNIKGYQNYKVGFSSQIVTSGVALVRTVIKMHTSTGTYLGALYGASKDHETLDYYEEVFQFPYSNVDSITLIIQMRDVEDSVDMEYILSGIKFGKVVY
jgi:hypothetical protein